MLSLSVPAVSPSVSLIPVVNDQNILVSMSVIADVSYEVLATHNQMHC